MTYASKQLAEALQQLTREAEAPRDYTTPRLPDTIEIKELQFPPTVAEFLTQASDYSKQTKSVSVGIY